MSNWPKEITIPLPKDFCKHTMTDGIGRHCLMGWANTHFPDFSQERFLMHGALAKEVSKKTGNFGVMGYGDADSTTNLQLAELYEKALEKVGYEIHE